MTFNSQFLSVLDSLDVKSTNENYDFYRELKADVASLQIEEVSDFDQYRLARALVRKIDFKDPTAENTVLSNLKRVVAQYIDQFEIVIPNEINIFVWDDALSNSFDTIKLWLDLNPEYHITLWHDNSFLLIDYLRNTIRSVVENEGHGDSEVDDETILPRTTILTRSALTYICEHWIDNVTLESVVTELLTDVYELESSAVSAHFERAEQAFTVLVNSLMVRRSGALSPSSTSDFWTGSEPLKTAYVDMLLSGQNEIAKSIARSLLLDQQGIHLDADSLPKPAEAITIRLQQNVLDSDRSNSRGSGSGISGQGLETDQQEGINFRNAPDARVIAALTQELVKKLRGTGYFSEAEGANQNDGLLAALVLEQPAYARAIQRELVGLSSGSEALFQPLKVDNRVFRNSASLVENSLETSQSFVLVTENCRLGELHRQRVNDSIGLLDKLGLDLIGANQNPDKSSLNDQRKILLNEIQRKNLPLDFLYLTHDISDNSLSMDVASVLAGSTSLFYSTQKLYQQLSGPHGLPVSQKEMLLLSASNPYTTIIRPTATAETIMHQATRAIGADPGATVYKRSLTVGGFRISLSFAIPINRDQSTKVLSPLIIEQVLVLVTSAFQKAEASELVPHSLTRDVDIHVTSQTGVRNDVFITDKKSLSFVINSDSLSPGKSLFHYPGIETHNVNGLSQYEKIQYRGEVLVLHLLGQAINARVNPDEYWYEHTGKHFGISRDIFRLLAQDFGSGSGSAESPDGLQIPPPPERDYSSQSYLDRGYSVRETCQLLFLQHNYQASLAPVPISQAVSTLALSSKLDFFAQTFAAQVLDLPVSKASITQWKAIREAKSPLKIKTIPRAYPSSGLLNFKFYQLNQLTINLVRMQIHTQHLNSNLQSGVLSQVGSVDNYLIRISDQGQEPVYRQVIATDESTRVYDPASGALLNTYTEADDLLVSGTIRCRRGTGACGVRSRTNTEISEADPKPLGSTQAGGAGDLLVPEVVMNDWKSTAQSANAVFAVRSSNPDAVDLYNHVPAEGFDVTPRRPGALGVSADWGLQAGLIPYEGELSSVTGIPGEVLSSKLANLRGIEKHDYRAVQLTVDLDTIERRLTQGKVSNRVDVSESEITLTGQKLVDGQPVDFEYLLTKNDNNFWEVSVKSDTYKATHPEFKTFRPLLVMAEDIGRVSPKVSLSLTMIIPSETEFRQLSKASISLFGRQSSDYKHLKSAFQDYNQARLGGGDSAIDAASNFKTALETYQARHSRYLDFTNGLIDQVDRFLAVAAPDLADNVDVLPIRLVTEGVKLVSVFKKTDVSQISLAPENDEAPLFRERTGDVNSDTASALDRARLNAQRRANAALALSEAEDFSGRLVDQLNESASRHGLPNLIRNPDDGSPPVNNALFIDENGGHHIVEGQKDVDSHIRHYSLDDNYQSHENFVYNELDDPAKAGRPGVAAALAEADTIIESGRYSGQLLSDIVSQSDIAGSEPSPLKPPTSTPETVSTGFGLDYKPAGEGYTVVSANQDVLTIRIQAAGSLQAVTENTEIQIDLAQYHRAYLEGDLQPGRLQADIDTMVRSFNPDSNLDSNSDFARRLTDYSVDLSQVLQTDTPAPRLQALADSVPARANIVAETYKWLNFGGNSEVDNYIPLPGFQRSNVEVPESITTRIITNLFYNMEGIDNNKIPFSESEAFARLFVESTLGNDWGKRAEILVKLEEYGYQFSANESDGSVVSFWSGNGHKQYTDILNEAQVDGKKIVFLTDIEGIIFANHLNNEVERLGRAYISDSSVLDTVQTGHMANTGFWSSFYAAGAQEDVYVISEGGARVGNYFWNVELPMLRELQRRGIINEIKLLDQPPEAYQDVPLDSIGRRITDPGFSVKSRFDALNSQKQQEFITRNPDILYSPNTLVDVSINPAAIDNMVSQVLPFYQLRKERNLYVSQTDDGYEVTVWGNRQSTTKSITFGEGIEPGRGVATAERFILANYDSFSDLPERLHVSASEIIAYEPGLNGQPRSQLLARKSHGVWTYLQESKGQNIASEPDFIDLAESGRVRVSVDLDAPLRSSQVDIDTGEGEITANIRLGFADHDNRPISQFRLDDALTELYGAAQARTQNEEAQVQNVVNKHWDTSDIDPDSDYFGLSRAYQRQEVPDNQAGLFAALTEGQDHDSQFKSGRSRQDYIDAFKSLTADSPDKIATALSDAFDYIRANPGENLNNFASAILETNDGLGGDLQLDFRAAFKPDDLALLEDRQQGHNSEVADEIHTLAQRAAADKRSVRGNDGVNEVLIDANGQARLVLDPSESLNAPEGLRLEFILKNGDGESSYVFHTEDLQKTAYQILTPEGSDQSFLVMRDSQGERSFFVQTIDAGDDVSPYLAEHVARGKGLDTLVPDYQETLKFFSKTELVNGVETVSLYVLEGVNTDAGLYTLENGLQIPREDPRFIVREVTTGRYLDGVDPNSPYLGEEFSVSGAQLEGYTTNVILVNTEGELFQVESNDHGGYTTRALGADAAPVSDLAGHEFIRVEDRIYYNKESSARFPTRKTNTGYWKSLLCLKGLIRTIAKVDPKVPIKYCQ